MSIRCFRKTMGVCVLGSSLVWAASSGAIVPNSRVRPSAQPSSPGELVNLTAAGSSLKWIRTFSDFFSEKNLGDTEDSQGEASWPTGDGDLVLAGQARLSPAGPNDPYVHDLILLEVRPMGEVGWTFAYEARPPQDLNILYNQGGLVRLGDGDYLLVAQWSTFDQNTAIREDYPILIKVGPAGQFRWARLIGLGSRGESLHADAMPPTPTSDGGVILAGHSSPSGSWLVKLDAHGEVSWGKKLSIGLGLGHPCGTSDGGFALIGYSSSRQAILAKFDGRGSIQWHRNYSQGSDWGCGEVQSFASTVSQTSDGGYVISGETGGYDCGGDTRAEAWFCKLTASGEIVWQKKVHAGHILRARDGGFVAHRNGGELFKIGVNGSRQWFRLFGHTTIGTAAEAENGDLVVTGHMYPDDSSHPVMEVLHLNSAGTMANACPLISSPVDTTVVGEGGLHLSPATAVTAVSRPVWTEPQPDKTVSRGCKVTTRCVSSLYRKPLVK